MKGVLLTSSPKIHDQYFEFKGNHWNGLYFEKIKNYKKKKKVSSSSCWDLRTLVQMLLSKLFPLLSLSRVYYFPCYTTMTETSPIFSTKIVLVHVWTKKDISDKNKYKTKVKPHRPMLKRSSGASLFS